MAPFLTDDRRAHACADGRCITADEALAALHQGAPIHAPTAVVVAHPDDETAGLGARLAGFRDLTLIHVTDGAPADPRDAMRAGFADAAGYRRARACELGAALAVLGVRPRRLALGLQDQTAALGLADLARSLRAALRGAALVVTHAYEGGHPDHDACAFAVQGVCEALARSGEAPPLRLEFAGYHKAGGGRVTGRFWRNAGAPSVCAAVSEEALARKRAALAAFRTQAEVLAWFAPSIEAYRAAPTYDFTRPPPPGAALYDDWGFALTSAAWREAARLALAQLEQDPIA